MTTIIADTHCHIYPNYELKFAFASAIKNFRAHSAILSKDSYNFSASDSELVICLTEKAGCNFFKQLANREIEIDGFQVNNTAENTSLAITDGTSSIYLLAGRQLATKERLEVLGLGVDFIAEDGLDLTSAVSTVKSNGAVPVIPWALGKWLGKRSTILSEFLSANPGQVYISDSALRPVGWTNAGVKQMVSIAACKLLVGTDPLPIKGEEARIASYCSVLSSQFDRNNPTMSFLNALKATNTYQAVGSRVSILGTAKRLLSAK